MVRKRKVVGVQQMTAARKSRRSDQGMESNAIPDRIAGDWRMAGISGFTVVSGLEWFHPRNALEAV